MPNNLSTLVDQKVLRCRASGIGPLQVRWHRGLVNKLWHVWVDVDHPRWHMRRLWHLIMLLILLLEVVIRVSERREYHRVS